MNSEATARRGLPIMLCVLSLLCSPWATARENCPDISSVANQSDAVLALDRLRLAGALGDAACTTPLCQRIADYEAAPASARKSAMAETLITEISASAATLQDRHWVDQIRNRLAAWQTRLAVGNVADLPTAVWSPSNLTLFPGHADAVDFAEILDDECPNGVRSCRDTFELAACSYSHAVLQRRVLLEMLDADRTETVRYLTSLNRQWQAFNRGGRSLMPWELALNSWHIENTQGDARGFVRPPSRQWILLHPSLAIDYAGSSAGGLEEALVLEIAGFYRWRWGGKDKAELERPLGASVIANWTGDGGVGYGLMVHLPRNFSIGVSRRSINGDDETTVLLSVDVAKFLFEEQRLRTDLVDKLNTALQR